MIPQTFPTRKPRRSSNPTPRKKVRTRERPRVYFVGSLYDSVARVASRDDDRERDAPSGRLGPNAPSADAHTFFEHLYGDHEGFADEARDPRTARCRRVVAFAVTSRSRRRVFQKGNALFAACVASAATEAVGGSNPNPNAIDFFRRHPRDHCRRILRVWARSGVFRARDARRARARRRRRGRSFFLLVFSLLAFFFSRLVNTRSRRNLDCGRDARSPSRLRARIGRRRARDATHPSPSGGSRRARARVAVAAAEAPPDRRVTRRRIPRTSLSSRSASGFSRAPR